MMIIKKKMLIIIFLIFSCTLSQSSANGTCRESFSKEFEWYEYNLSFNFPCPREELKFLKDEEPSPEPIGKRFSNASILRENGKKFLNLELKEYSIPNYYQIYDQKNGSEILGILTKSGYHSKCEGCLINEYKAFCGTGFDTAKNISTNFTRIWIPGLLNPRITLQLDIHSVMPINETRSGSTISKNDFKCLLGSVKVI